MRPATMALLLFPREHQAKVCPRSEGSNLRFLCSETIQASKDEKRREVATPLTTLAKRMQPKELPVVVGTQRVKHIILKYGSLIFEVQCGVEAGEEGT